MHKNPTEHFKKHATKNFDNTCSKRIVKTVISFIGTLDFINLRNLKILMSPSYRTFLQINFTKWYWRTFLQDYPTKRFYWTTPQNTTTDHLIWHSYKTILQNNPWEHSYKTIPKNIPTEYSHRTSLQINPIHSYKTIPQNIFCRTLPQIIST